MINYGQLFGHSDVTELVVNILLITASSLATGFPAAIAYEAYRCVFRDHAMEPKKENKLAIKYSIAFGSVGIM